MKRPLPVCGWIWVFSIWVLACQPEPIAPVSALAVRGPAQEAPVPPPPGTPARNCQITIVNASTHPMAHMAVALGTPDMAGLMQALHCPIAPGTQARICLPQGEHTLYTFSNMYQFSRPIQVSIGTAPQTLRLKSGH